MIERIPKVQMPEEAITGFVISVLCQKDGLIRRELNAHAVTTKALLFRILSSISLKRKLEVNEPQQSDSKRPRIADSRFLGKCHWCGIPGHRQADCRKRREDSSATTKQQDSLTTARASDRNSTVTCYICGNPGHVATNCQEKGKGVGAVARKEVNLCEQRLLRGTLRTLSGEPVTFYLIMGRLAL